MNQAYEIVITAHEQAELMPCDAPAPPEPGRIAGPTLASLISAGTELNYSYQGESFPARPGYAAVFRVDAVGEGVEDIAVGDVVLAMGNHSSHQNHPAETVWKVPNGLAPADATFARLMGVSMSTLVTTTARPPDRVLVTGLGPVGHLAAQIFQACGYRVLASDPDATRRELAVRGGIGDVAEKPSLDDDAWEKKYALVVECSGHEQAVLDGCRLVRERGEVVLIGVPWRKRTDLSAHELMHSIFHRYVVVRSGWEWEVPRSDVSFRTGSIRANIAAALDWLQVGKVKVAGNYTIYNPHNCQDAYQALLHGREKGLAIVFDWTAINGN